MSLFAYRAGVFIVVGTLKTGQLPAQVIAADLDGSGWDDLVVRNAGDGTLSLFRNNRRGSFQTGFADPFRPGVSIPVGLGASDVRAADTTGDGLIDLVVSNDLTGQVNVLYHEPGGAPSPRPCPLAPGPA